MDFLLVIIELLSLAVRLRRYKRKSAISLQHGHIDPKISGRRGRPPPIIFARVVRPMNAHNSAADSFHTKKLCSRLSAREVRL